MRSMIFCLLAVCPMVAHAFSWGGLYVGGGVGWLFFVGKTHGGF